MKAEFNWRTCHRRRRFSSLEIYTYKSKYENGVLRLTIPKKEQQKVNGKKQILIEG